MKTIEIIVSPDGQTRLQTKGFARPEYQHAGRFLESAPGMEAAERLTAEFHLTTEGEQRNREHSR